jgi:hypothetical protein
MFDSEKTIAEDTNDAYNKRTHFVYFWKEKTLSNLTVKYYTLEQGGIESRYYYDWDLATVNNDDTLTAE